jgi:acetyl esterase/lipase
MGLNFKENCFKLFSLKRSNLFLLLLLTTTLMTGCGSSSSSNGGGTDTQSSRGDLVGYTVLQPNVTTTQSNATFQQLKSSGVINATALYEVANYKISYITIDPYGNMITASGLLSVPQKASSTSSPILSYQHGTIFLNSLSPSKNYSSSSPSVLAASLGYIVSSPDYIGYGDSFGNSFHPYSHSATLASCSIDMLRAVKTFLQENAINTNGQLFLAGYSEGGKATMAMHRAIQTSLNSEFKVTASAPGSGNYDMTETASAIMNAQTLAYPAYVGWVIKSYNEIYQLNSLSTIISTAYLDTVANSYDGTKTGNEINALLPALTSNLLNPQFITDYTGSGAIAFKDAVADNNDYDWSPAAPTRLFHGQSDLTVPYLNTENAYAKMVANGSTSVQIENCNAGGNVSNHENCYYPYMGYIYGFFAMYATDL